MPLPPKSPNEPEWLVVQRANRAADRQFALAFAPMQVTLAISFAPLLFIDPSRISTSILFVGLAAYGAVIVGICIRGLRPRTTAKTMGRYVVNYVGIFWGVVSLLAILGTAVSLVA